MKKRTIGKEISRTLRKKKTQKRLSIFIQIFWIPFLLILFFGISLYIPFPKLILEDITGDIQMELKDDIKQYTEVILDEKRFGISRSKLSFFNTDNIVKNIEKEFLQIKNITVKRYINSFSLDIYLRDVFATHCFEEECVLIDTTGFVFSKTELVPHITVSISEKINIGEYVLDSNSIENSELIFKNLVKITERLEGRGMFVKNIELLRDSPLVVFHLQDRSFELWVDLRISLEQNLQSFEIIFDEVFPTEKSRSKIKFFDIRNPGSLEYATGKSSNVQIIDN